MLLGIVTILANYNAPGGFFWDENYHVASAQKYLNDVYFMEPHPPLGKLLIAAGEGMVNYNPGSDSEFIATDYAKDPPDSFDLGGYRIFPVLFLWWTIPLLWMLAYLLTLKRWVASVVSSMLIFDNAIVVHGRGAMLESIQIFFIVATILCFFWLRLRFQTKKHLYCSSAMLGLCFGLAMATKYSSLVLICLWIVIPTFMWKRWKNMASVYLLSFAVAVLSFCAVWQIHFSLGTKVQTELPDNGYYKASEVIKSEVDARTIGQLSNFPTHLRDSIAFADHYEKGVPRLDLSKADENGSPWFTWPFGGRTISYKWQQVSEKVYKYVYLVPNPVVWGLGLIGLLYSFSVCFLALFKPQKINWFSGHYIIFGLYIGYMIGMARIDRVMYLYHYFIPLLLSFLLFGIMLSRIEFVASKPITEVRRKLVSAGLITIILLTFLFYRGFTYFLPMHDNAVAKRSLLQLWELRCVNCEQPSEFVDPNNLKQEDEEPAEEIEDNIEEIEETDEEWLGTDNPASASPVSSLPKNDD